MLWAARLILPGLSHAQSEKNRLESIVFNKIENGIARPGIIDPGQVLIGDKNRPTIIIFLAHTQLNGIATGQSFGLEQTEVQEIDVNPLIVQGSKPIGVDALVVLDEANVAVTLDLFPVEALLALIDCRPTGVELVITGRGADPRVVDRADLVTEMREVKHYFNHGVKARRGIEK